MSTTSNQTTSSTGSKVPVTGKDNSCYLCGEHKATHVGFCTHGPVGAHVGLCEDCWTLNYSEYETSIDPEGTWGHQKVVCSDGSVAYTYETEEGTYILTQDSLIDGEWTRSGPHEESHFIEATTAAGGHTESVDQHQLPAVPGNAIPLPEHTTKRVACPECGSIRTVTLDSLREHNEHAHSGEQVAKPVDEFEPSDFPSMDAIPNSGDWVDEFGGSITADGTLVDTRVHEQELGDQSGV